MRSGWFVVAMVLESTVKGPEHTKPQRSWFFRITDSDQREVVAFMTAR